MRLYGRKSMNDIPLRLQQMELSCSLAELRKLIRYFEYVMEKHSDEQNI